MGQAEHAVYPLADYPATAHALEQGCAFVAGVDLDGSDPAEVAMLHELGYNALLAVGTFDGKRGYLLRDLLRRGPFPSLSAIAAHVHVLAHYCVQAVTGQHRSPRGTTAALRASAEDPANLETSPPSRCSPQLRRPSTDAARAGSRSRLRGRLRRARSAIVRGARSPGTWLLPGHRQRGLGRWRRGIETALLAVVIGFVITTVPGVRAEPGWSWLMDGILQNLAYGAAAALCVLRTPPSSPDPGGLADHSGGLGLLRTGQHLLPVVRAVPGSDTDPVALRRAVVGLLSMCLRGVGLGDAGPGGPIAVESGTGRGSGRIGRGDGRRGCRGSPNWWPTFSGGVAQTAVNVIYPAADLLLLAMVVFAMSLLQWRPPTALWCLAVGLVIFGFVRFHLCGRGRARHLPTRRLAGFRVGRCGHTGGARAGLGSATAHHP